MSKKITEKIRELLTPEDLTVFEGAIEGMIEDRVSGKLGELIALKEEELKQKYDTLSEEYVASELDKRLSDEKAKIVESYDKKLSLLEQKVVGKLDSFLDHVIVEQISDEMLEKIAINETLAPVVEGIRKVFGDNYLQLNSNPRVKLDELQEKVNEIKSELSESIEKRMELETKLEKSAVYLLISEKTNGLKTSDKQKVVEMFKDKEFDETEKNIDNYVTLIKETTDVKRHKKSVIRETKKTIKQKVASVNEGTVVDNRTKKVANPVAEDTSLMDIANKYLLD